MYPHSSILVADSKRWHGPTYFGTQVPSVRKEWGAERIRPLVQESSSVIQAHWNLG